MYELLISNGFDYTFAASLMVSAALIGLGAGGAPGVGSLAGPVVALGFTRFDKPQAIVTSLLIMGQAKCLFPPQRRHIDWRMTLFALIPATAGLIAGISFWAWLIALPDSIAAQQTVKAFCGLVVMAISFDILMARVLQFYKPPQLGIVLSLMLAFFGGILSTVANVAGPLFTWYFQSKGASKDTLTATVACFFFILNVFKVPFYLWLGLFHEPHVLQSVADWILLGLLGLVTLLAWKVGALWRAHASEQWFSFPICLAGLSVGLLVIWQTMG